MLRSLVLAFAFLFLFNIRSDAQAFLGLKVAYTSYLGTGIRPITFGIQGEKLRSESLSFRIAFDIGTGGNKNKIYNAYALSTATSPSAIFVTGDSKVTTYHLGFDGKRFFFKGNFYEGGVYAGLGTGFTAASMQTTYDFGNYDKAEYSVTGFADEEAKSWYFQYMIRASVGYDFSGPFVEFKINIPANNVNDTPVPVQIGPNIGLGLGVRF